jgi:hypothetical protein
VLDDAPPLHTYSHLLYQYYNINQKVIEYDEKLAPAKCKCKRNGNGIQGGAEQPLV